MLVNDAVYNYETSNDGPYGITQCFANGTVSLKCGEIKLGINYIALSHIHFKQTLKILNVEKYVRQ